MTARHCATCNCADDANPPQPATSTPAVRAQVLRDVERAIRDGKAKGGRA